MLFLQFNVAATEMAMMEKERRFHASWNTRPCTIDESNDRPSTYTEYVARRCKQAQIMYKTAPIFEVVFALLIKLPVRRTALVASAGSFGIRFVRRNSVARKSC